MPIPDWLSKVAEDITAESSTYKTRIEKLKADAHAQHAEALEEAEQLADLLDAVLNKIEGIHKEAKDVQPTAKVTPAPKSTSETFKLTPEEEQAQELIADAPEVPPKTLDLGKGSKGKVPAKIKQPETTKWKEIRFNKRTGTWQVIVTIRHSRNFLSENDAVEFTKKANLQE